MSLEFVPEAGVLHGSQKGRFENSKWRHLNEILFDYNPALELRYVPSEVRNTSDCPYIITHTDKLGSPYVVMILGESDTLEDILTKIIQSDSRQGSQLANMQARNFASKLAALKEKEDELAAERDLTQWLMETNKSTFLLKDKDGQVNKFDSRLNKRPIRSIH